MFPELDALFHQGHEPQNPEKQLQLMSSILDPHKLVALLHILQSDPGTPSEDVHQGGQSSTQPPQQRLHIQRRGLPGRQQNVGPLPATVGPLPAASSGPPLDVDHSLEPTVNNESEPVAVDPTQQAAIDHVQQAVVNPAPPPVVNPEPVGGGENLQAGNVVGIQQQDVSPEPTVNNESEPVTVDPTQQAAIDHVQQAAIDHVQQAVVNPAPPPVVNPAPPPVVNPEPVVGGENLQAGNVVGIQQQDVNANVYDGFAIHGLTRQGFNVFTMRFKAVNDLTLKEYICILRNRESFDVRDAPMHELKEGVVVYHVPPALNLDRVVSDGGADGHQWNQQRSYSRQILQERVRYTRYQCQADTY